MKIIRFALCAFLLVGSANMSAEDAGFWGWLTGVTSSAWEGTKNTVYSIFGGKPEEKVVYKKEEVREVAPDGTVKTTEEVVEKEKTVVKK